MNVQLMSRSCALALLSLCAATAAARVDDGGHAACSAEFIDMLTTRGVPPAAITDKGPAAQTPPAGLRLDGHLRRWVLKAEQGGEVVATGDCLVSVRSGAVRRLSLQPGPAMPAALTTAAR